MNPLITQFWIGIGIAAPCGGIIGFERQIRGKPATRTGNNAITTRRTVPTKSYG